MVPHNLLNIFLIPLSPTSFPPFPNKSRLLREMQEWMLYSHFVGLILLSFITRNSSCFLKNLHVFDKSGIWFCTSSHWYSCQGAHCCCNPWWRFAVPPPLSSSEADARMGNFYCLKLFCLFDSWSGAIGSCKKVDKVRNFDELGIQGMNYFAAPNIRTSIEELLISSNFDLV